MGSFWTQEQIENEEHLIHTQVKTQQKAMPPIIKTLLHYIDDIASNPRDAEQSFLDNRILSMGEPQQTNLIVEVHDNDPSWQYLNIAMNCKCDKEKDIAEIVSIIHGLNNHNNNINHNHYYSIIPNEIVILIFKYFYDSIISFNFYQSFHHINHRGGAASSYSIMSEWIPASAMRIIQFYSKQMQFVVIDV